jgi:uncharacterized protein with HEPN domain
MLDSINAIGQFITKRAIPKLTGGLSRISEILAHEYFGVNSEIVWDVIVSKLPVLKGLLEVIVWEE